MTIIETRTARERERLEEMRAECYYNHDWQPSGPSPKFVRTGKFLAAYYLVHKKCRKCGSYRSQGLRKNGSMVPGASRYYWAEGYARDKDEERPSANQMRLWWAKRNAVLGIRAA